jgi:hypothetical protein
LSGLWGGPLVGLLIGGLIGPLLGIIVGISMGVAISWMIDRLLTGPWWRIGLGALSGAVLGGVGGKDVFWVFLGLLLGALLGSRGSRAL